MGRKSDSRLRLMQAAQELIWESSYGAVTIEAICERAQVRKGSFYYFFDSKSDLVCAAVRSWWDERTPVVRAIYRPEVPPLERIRKYIDLAVDHLTMEYNRKGQVLGCPFFTLGSEICTQDERLRSMVQDILSGILENFENAVRDAQACGDIDSAGTELKVRQLWAFYEGSLTRARIDNNLELIRNLSSNALELIGARPRLAEVA